MINASNGTHPPPRAGAPAMPLIGARGVTVQFGKVTALNGLDLIAPHAQFAAVEPAMTGRENLQMTARLFGHHKSAARRAASAVIEQLGLEEVADRRCGTYSGGQRRRLDLGASLVGAPRLLLLDEPTTGLDPTGRREVWDAVRALAAAGTDVLLTTHYLDEADELADHVVVIDHGRAIASGRVGELMASVGRDVIEVAVADSARLDEAGRILEGVTSNLPRLDRGGRRASAPAAGGARELATVIRCLDDAAVGVDEIGVRRPTLDVALGAPGLLIAEHVGGIRTAPGWRFHARAYRS
ncbi:MAG TPA: ATP-binding cassette domain-containing protein [Streptosporangiaceae bacterium]|nr:ATP-binding cassette domain-containing protein [Streptosporangiaceae bacterium]